MKIFIDSADIGEIREAAAMGVIDGVTTNPSLVAKTGRTLEAVVRDICEVVDGPISAEVLATDTEGIVAEGRRLAAMHPNVVVKVPLIAAGIKAVRLFKQEGIRTNVTLCFSAPQALLAASIRHRVHLVRCAEMGADVATIPHSVILQLLKHPLTDIGLARFLQDAKKIPV